MKASALRFALILLFACALTTLAFGATAPKSAAPKSIDAVEETGYSPAMKAKISQMQAKLKQYEKDEAAVKKNLKTFDTLDFVVFSGQQWARLHESHSKDVVVDWPDGHHTNGIDRHIKDLKALFVHAPDTKITMHFVRFGVYRGATGSAIKPTGKIEEHLFKGGDGFTCVTGEMTGHFTKPMPIGGGKVIKPTGKRFSVPMCTVGRWKNGVMVEEWLYWDNATYMKQIGLGK